MMKFRDPVFIHSMFRAGSTWLFNAFRIAGNGDSYYCYKEPFHENLLLLNNNPDALIRDPKPTNQLLRHPILGRPYFLEFHAISGSLRGLFRESFSVSEFFAKDENLPEDQKFYVTALINHAKSRPVLQFCRSSGRMRAMQNLFDGLHIHLWREPRSQWWSYKVADYFDTVTQRFYASVKIPDVLLALKKQWDVDGAVLGFLPTRANYAVFYGIWLYSWLQARQRMHVDVCIDRLAFDPDYRKKICMELAAHGITDVELGGCSINTLSLEDSEVDFYVEIEESIHRLFELHNYSQDEIGEMKRIVEIIRGFGDKESAPACSPIRAITLRYMERGTILNHAVKEVIKIKSQANPAPSVS
jgi:hypothetical protein